ncbi:MAG: hypothetical protein AAB897_00145 [Patescibacteria group bacterium]
MSFENLDEIERRECSIAGAADLFRAELEKFLPPEEAKDLAGYVYSAALEIDAIVRKVAQDPEFIKKTKIGFRQSPPSLKI